MTAPALTLFLRTAQRTHFRFQPDAREQQDLVRICELTAGMPLALELTAGWVNLLPTTAIAEALQANVDLLATTMHDVPVRHRSMRAIFDATWALLADEERQRFAQLSVFRGGFTLAAAQAVSQVTLQQLAFFVDKSLLDYQRKTERYTLHELLRQYASEKLGEYSERDEVHWRHLRYFLLLAETLAEQMSGPPQEKLLVNFDQELDNFRTALTWGFTTGATTLLIASSVAWLVARLARFWDLRRHWQEGSEWLDKALVLTKDQGQVKANASQPPDPIAEKHAIELQAVLLFQAGLFTIDLPLAQTLLEQSLAHYHVLGNQHFIAQCLYELGASVANQGDYRQAKKLYEESLLLARRIDDHYLIANALIRLAILLAEENEVQQASEFAQESLTHFRQLQDSRGMISSQILLAQCHLALGDYAQASALLEEVLALDRIINPGSKGGPWTYRVLGLVKQMQGDYAQATHYYQRSFLLRHENQLLAGMAWALEGLVEVAAATAQPLRAAHLGGAAESLRQQINSTISGDDLPRYQQALKSVCAMLGETRFQAAWASGSTLSVEQIVTYALADATLQETSLA